MPEVSVQYCIVEPDYAGQRIDNFLLARLKGLPKSHLYRVMRRGEIRVNKKRVKPSYRLQPQDVIRIPPLRLSQAAETAFISAQQQAEIRARILYEDATLLVLNKPTGIPVHGGTDVSAGVIDIVRQMYPQLKAIALVHRLDKETSGCLLIAKKRAALKVLQQQFQEGLIEKRYRTVLMGTLEKDRYPVAQPLKKNVLASGERIVKIDAQGKSALTCFYPLTRYRGATLVDVHLLTGRTHQIRVHAAHLGHPVGGDEKYGDKTFNKQLRQMGCKRLLLHASSIRFTLPGREEPILVEAPYDVTFEAILEKLLTC